ncbi:unnamed protein product [Rhizoctonia solani]|uniref:F-box domain-containing protein n=1 Tax=Rhizoctonia solani TaxID=456999 RepID=A0A8H3AUU4_9AGAM|nr:unnamed protein product [Rhizoctonia solani]CAE6441069.1 unnamed protein product [Rhizoctonia solani]
MVTIVLPSSHRIEDKLTLEDTYAIKHSPGVHTPIIHRTMPTNKHTPRSYVSQVSPHHTCHRYQLKANGKTIFYLPRRRAPAHLPVEVIGLIMVHLGEGDLSQASLVSQLFHRECIRIMYRIIPRMSLRRSTMAICALARSPKLASLVQSYTITLKHADPTGNLFRLLAKAISHMGNLRSLSFEVPGNKSWILHGCTANIRWFKTSLEFDDGLAAWLATKLSIHDLILTRAKAFSIQPYHLPNLSIVFGTPATVLSAVSGRPVASVCFGLNGPVMLDLSNLSKTTVSVDHLGVAFDPMPIWEELNCIDFVYRCSIHVPQVQKLSFFATRSCFSPTFYRIVAPLLSRFPALKYLQFVLGENRTASPIDRATQLELLQDFHYCSPELRTVTFPGNLTWNIE